MANEATVAAPTSIHKLRQVAYVLRKKIGLADKCFFPIMQFLELIMPRIDPRFHIEIRTKREMGHCHGQACPEKHVIYLRDDVYDGAYHDKGRDRFTIAHEIGHYFLHGPGSVAYARVEQGKKIEAYREPEWQANTLAAELLMPYHLIQGMNYMQLANQCGVSYRAAEVQLDKISRRRR